MCFFNSAEKAYLDPNVRFNPLKILKGRQYSFQKLIQFSQVNKVLNSPASNLDGLPSRDTWVSSTQLNRPIWSKLSFSPP
jgi:hypothetical protein